MLSSFSLLRRWVGAAVPALARSSGFISILRFDCPQAKFFPNLYTHHKSQQDHPSEKPRHFKSTSKDLLPRKKRWRGRRGRQWPGLRAENLSTWWRSARWPSAATRRRARWTWAWATRASSPVGTSRSSRRVRTALAAETSTCGASAKTGCSWTGYFRDAGLLLSSFPECKTTKVHHCSRFKSTELHG